VYEDSDGRQYVVDGDEERMYGEWLRPADEPFVLREGSRA
jgi:hypothetical protein